MLKVFNTLDKIKPLYDFVDKATLCVCKILLIIDILITGYVVIARYVPSVPGASWSEEIVLSCMAYMAVLSAALAIRRGTHIRMTAFDRMLPKTVIYVSDLIADIGVLVLAYIMITVGWEYAQNIGRVGTYVTMPSVSRFWMYFPVPLAGIAMVVFEIEAIYEHIKRFFVKEVTE